MKPALSPYLADDLETLMDAAAQRRDVIFGRRITYSRKVFIPLTRLCRDVCHYCTFAQPPRALAQPYLDRDSVLRIAEEGARHGCREALFTLGERPEKRYRTARAALAEAGHETTLSYLAEMADLVRRETGLLPHINAGALDRGEYEALRPHAASMGMMLESLDPALALPGGPHHGSPDKTIERRLASLEAAGEAGVPFTTGILAGIGENRAQRLADLARIAAAHERFGHVQEVIIQNFRAKPGTRMAGCAEPSLGELCWTIAATRLSLPDDISLQAPPNLSPGAAARLVASGIDDFGGISPVTPDHVNPEAPWPQIVALEDEIAPRPLVERLTVYPRFIAEAERWLDPSLAPAVLGQADAQGLARTDRWTAGRSRRAPGVARLYGGGGGDRETDRILRRALDEEELSETEIVRLFEARGDAARSVIVAADRLRRRLVGDTVTYVVNRNVNYTNICRYRCAFCAFSKGKTHAHLRGKPYRMDMAEITTRAREAAAFGATEICLQGGIHPEFTGDTYLAVLEAVRAGAPDIHIHAFSPLEVAHGAATLDLNPKDFLTELRRAGLGSLPGTAAEILSDDVRQRICPDKLDSRQWLSIVRTAHEAGLRTSSTIMFGHVEHLRHWARHLLLLRGLQRETGGITEFVPLPFVHMEAPMWLKGRCRPGPTFGETLLMHAVARLVFGKEVPHIQGSWVKLGRKGLARALAAGVDDVGGTLINESITRAAGADHGQHFDAAAMRDFITDCGRTPRQRTTLYGPVDPRAATIAQMREPAHVD